MEYIEIEGEGLEGAIEKACEKLHAPLNELDIEILSDESSSKGFFGLTRNKDKVTRIRAALKDKGEMEDGPLQQAKRTLEGLLKKLKFTSSVEAKREGEEMYLNVRGVRGNGSGLLIGRGGETLDALQHIINKMAYRLPNVRGKIVVDVENYRSRKQKSLTSLALRLEERAKKIGRPVTMKPMNAFDRRTVHRYFRGDPEITTKSEGEEPFRRIVIYPKREDIL